MIRVLFVISCILFAVQPASMAAANYNDSLKAGDEAMNSGNIELALQEFEAAIGHGVAEGEKAFARAKKAYVLAFKKKDYAAARTEVEEAAKVTTLSPVARLTVCQVLAEIQMKRDRNFAGAAAHLEEAMALPDVDFARPFLSLSLADCYRETGDFPKALDAAKAVLDTAGVSPQAKASAHFNMGLTYQYGLKDFENAKKSYGEAVKLNPGLKGDADSQSSKMP
jgi:tetratricopeptide (TPR) repeat protein